MESQVWLNPRQMMSRTRYKRQRGWLILSGAALNGCQAAFFVVAPVSKDELGSFVASEGLSDEIPDDHTLGREDGAHRQRGHKTYLEVLRRAEISMGRADSLLVVVNDESQIETARMSGAYVVGLSQELGGDELAGLPGLRHPNEIVPGLSELSRVL